MNALQRILLAFANPVEVKQQLLTFLGSDQAELTLPGGMRLTRDDARTLLRRMIPAHIEVRGVCARRIPVVVAAPHVSFDNWSEYFCNRAARALRTGWVVAKNFRDQDPRTIPANIGRHFHVNRPTESAGRTGPEEATERARIVYSRYVRALRRASGVSQLPFRLLIEFHSQRRTPRIEIASMGINADEARRIFEHYQTFSEQEPGLPEFVIEPIHAITMKAESAKAMGVLRNVVSMSALHVEIPREARRSESSRAALSQSLNSVFDEFIRQLEEDK